MKTTNRLLKLLLPVVAALFFYTVSSAQSLSDLTTMQSQLQSSITSLNAQIAAGNLSPQDLAAAQAQLAATQVKLSTVNALIQVYAYQQLRTQNDNALSQRQATESSIQAAQQQVQVYQQQSSQYDSITAVLQAAVAAQQALPSAIGTQATQPGAPASINTPRDPNNPFNVPLFISTGNAEQDAALLRQWQQAHPISK